MSWFMACLFIFSDCFNAIDIRFHLTLSLTSSALPDLEYSACFLKQVKSAWFDPGSQPSLIVETWLAHAGTTFHKNVIVAELGFSFPMSVPGIFVSMFILTNAGKMLLCFCFMYLPSPVLRIKSVVSHMLNYWVCPSPVVSCKSVLD